MAQKTWSVMIAVPDEKVVELEKFLKNLKKKGKLVRIGKFRGEISEISSGQVKRFKFNRYEVIVCGGKREAKEFFRSLHTNNLIPKDKQWIVCPIPNKFIRQ